jgi:hypothetical protein
MDDDGDMMPTAFHGSSWDTEYKTFRIADDVTDVVSNGYSLKEFVNKNAKKQKNEGSND